MADLPGNTSYGAATPATPKKQFPKLNINPGGSARASGPTSSGQTSGGFTPPTSVALGEQDTPKLTALPSSYSTFKQEAQFPYEKAGGLTAPVEPIVHQMPDTSMGQYIVDQTNPTGMVKSNREFVSQSVKKKILGNLPSQLFQVDHIIPLWANGADTPSNLQILSLAEHEKKTKMQAVPLTLLSAGIIDYTEARVLAQNWKNKTEAGIPDMPAEGGNGLLDVKTAREVYDRWKKEEISGPPVTWDSFKEAIPEAAKNFGEGWLPNWIREPIKGVVSGVTGGIMPYQVDDGGTGVDQALGIGGVIVGSVLGIGKFSKLMTPVLAKTGLKVFQPTKVGLSDLASTLSRSEILGKAAKPVGASLITAAKTGGLKGVGKAALENTKQNLSGYMTYLKQNAAGNIARNTAIFVPYGIAAEAGKALLSSEEEDILKNGMERLVLDIGMGGITGVAAPGLKAAAGVAFGTYVLDSALGTPWREAMLNAAVMGGLHGVGTLRPEKINNKKLQEAVEKEATNSMQNILHWWVPEIPEVALGKPGAFSGASVADDAARATHIKTAEEWTAKALEKLSGLKDSISSDDFEKHRRQIVTAGHYLRQTALPPAEREAAMLADLASVFQQAKNRTFDITVPETVPDFLRAAGEDRLFRPVAREKVIADTPTTGEIRVAGTGVEGVNEQNMVKFAKAVQEGRASTNLLVVNRPDSKALWELQSELYKPEEIAGLTHKPFQNPQNAAQVYGLTRNADGSPELISLGWIPRKFTIDEKVNNYNSQKEIVEGTFPRNNPERNKDSIVARMTEEDIPVITMRLEKPVVPASVMRGTRGKNQGGPYLIARLSEGDWAASKQSWDDYRATGGTEAVTPGPIAAAAQKTGAPVMETPEIQPMQESISSGLEMSSQNMKAQDVLANPLLAESSKPGQRQVADYLGAVDDAVVAGGDSKTTTNNLVKIGVSPDTAARVAAGEPVTAEEIVGSIRRENLIGEEATQNMVRVLGPDKKQWFKPGTPGEKWGKLPVTKAPAKEAPVAETQQDALPLPAPAEAVPSPLASSIVARATKGDIPMRPVRAKEPVAEQPAKTETPAPAVEAPFVPTPAYQEAKAALERVSQQSETNLDQTGLDSYTDSLIRFIQNSNTDPDTQKALAKDAMRLIGRSRDELSQEGIEMTRSNEAWEKQIRGTGHETIGKYIDSLRERIAREFDTEVTTPRRTQTPETKEEAISRVVTGVKEDAAPYLKMVSDWKNLSPLTYQYGHNMTFDTLARNIWGPNYTKNYNLMRFFSDKDKLGKAIYHKGMVDPRGEVVRNKRGGEVGAMFATETASGRQISQPKSVVAALGVGDRAGASRAMADRARALGAARRSIEESQANGAVAKPIEAAADVSEGDLTSNYRIEDPTQAASENIQDLTKYEGKNLLGLLSGIENGATPRLQPVRGAEDAATQIFDIIESWNLAIKNGYIMDSPVRISDKKLLQSIKDRVSKDTETALGKEKSLASLRQELTKLEKANEVLDRVNVPQSHRGTIDEELAGNNARIAELKKALGIEESTEAPISDGQGGPGYTPESPAMLFPTLSNIDTAISTPETFRAPKLTPKAVSILPGATANQTAGEYIQGKSTYEKGQTAANPTPFKKLSVTGALTSLSEGRAKVKNAEQSFASKAFKTASEVPGKAFEGLVEAVATGVDKVVGNKPTIYQKGKSEPSAVIMGYDTTVYATDPAHPQKLTSIIRSLPAGTNNAATVESYIRTKFPKSPVTGQMVMQAASKHGVAPEMMIAIMQNDSGFGTAGLGAKTRNPGNVGNDDSGATQTYKTWGAGVEAVAKWLSNHKAYAAER